MDIKVALALGSAILFATIGDILLSVGMRKTGGVSIRKPADILVAIRLAFTNQIVLLGVLSMAFHFGSYIAALTWVDVSIANPMTALSYLLATIYARAILHEHICFQRAMGVVFVSVGAILVGLSS